MSGYDSWWTINGQALIDALRRAHAGDAPEVVYAELYANSTHDRPTNAEGGESRG